MSLRTAYEELLRRSREQALLGSCSAVLGWDEQTYLPPGGAGHRGEQMALLAGLQHERATDPKVGELLGELEGSDLVADPGSPESANVRELRRAFDRQGRLPRSLVEELARATTLAQQEWATARRDRDFPRFRPWLETIVGLKRREAECQSGGVASYDALLEDYEPGARAQDLTVLFAALRAELVPLVAAIADSPRQPDPEILQGAYPVDRQRIFGEVIAAAVGFDFDRGRLDTTAHPFCSGIGPGDCRITTRYNPRDFSDSFFGILHEVGHGLYEQGLDPAAFGTPLGDSASLGVHESQSRLWENAVGRSRSFWTFAFPLARRFFPEPLRGVDPDAFLFAVNRVAPGPIRVQADEVTYNLHILARFELEQALLSGDLSPADLPGAWAERYRHDLGLTPRDDSEGCLQDIHWAAGLFGYFPTYTLGNLYAAQLFSHARSDLGNLDASFSQGEFLDLLSWLRERIHHPGRRYPAAELIQRATGSPPDHLPLMQTLRQKYGELYQIPSLSP